MATKRRSRNAAGRHQAARAAQKAKVDAAGEAASAQGSAVKNYLGAGVDRAREAAGFDRAKSQRLRQQSAADKKRIDATSKTQRVSARKKSRANELARTHGRTDEQKIESKAQASRTGRLIKDAALAVAPGGAAGAVTAKVGYAKKALKGAKYVAGAAKKLGAGSIKQGLKAGAKTIAARAQKAGVKGVGKYVAKQGTKLAKYKAKKAAQGELNTTIAGAAG